MYQITFNSRNIINNFINYINKNDIKLKGYKYLQYKKWLYFHYNNQNTSIKLTNLIK